MSRIWIPEGNNSQTEIDVAISQLQYGINQLENEKQYHQYEALKILSLLEEVQYALRYVQKNLGIVISIYEYQSMIREEKRYKRDLDLLKQMIHDCSAMIESQKAQINQLTKKREQLGTKILEFKRRK